MAHYIAHSLSKSNLPENHVEHGNDGAELLHPGLRHAGVVHTEDHDVQDHADAVDDDGEPDQLLGVGADNAQQQTREENQVVNKQRLKRRCNLNFYKVEHRQLTL